MQQRSLKMLWKTANNIIENFFILSSSVMDDKYDTYKTANIDINQSFILNA
jgi:hypothetical protein